MELIHWDESLITGIAVIDAQNKMLVNKTNKLHSSIQNNNFSENLNELLGELFEFTDYHFDIEEEFLNKYDYLEKEAHLQEHDNFREYIKSYINDKDRNDLLAATNILVYLNTWINHHIKEVDMEYMSFLKKM